ncbi:MAG TPA: hypothetical protein VJ768_08520 [Anaerolineales bacterium]|nr:hypothetical protein [Anaerolineales bacterium]
MNHTTRTILIIVGAAVAGAVLLFACAFIGLSAWGFTGVWPWSVMGGNFALTNPVIAQSQFDYPMGPGMMGGLNQVNPGEPYSGFGMMGPGMMGGLGASGAAPLTLAEAQQAVQDYLDGLNNPDLVVSEVMIFDNHAYAEIEEQNSGIGAMEVLVDPATKAVYPEHGPNMMWNLKYGRMSGSGMFGMMGRFGPNFGGMMGGLNQNLTPEDISADMPVSSEQAVAAAQDYLDAYLPGAEADDHADPFYGYYTLHILRDGDVAGMLSVNGFTGQVFPHTWHGDFVEMSEGDPPPTVI